MGRGVLKVTFSRLIGLGIFLVFLALANSLSWNNATYSGIVVFLNSNLWIIILFSVLFYLGELFFLFSFPINSPAPVFNAIGGVFLVNFIFRTFQLVEDIVSQDIFYSFYPFKLAILLIVFFGVLIFGYIKVFSSMERREERKEVVVEKKVKKEFIEDVEEKPKKKVKTESIGWGEIGNEFKLALYNIGRSLKRIFEPREKKEKSSEKKKKTGDEDDVDEKEENGEKERKRIKGFKHKKKNNDFLLEE